MNIEKIDLNEIYNLGVETPLKCFLHSNVGELEPYNRNLPSLIVVPGGAYAFCSEREKDPIAAEFFPRHCNVFVLTYACAPKYRYPTSLMQLAATVDYIKENADSLGADKERIFAVGFSAGGHLVANLAVACDELSLDGRKLDARVKGVVLSYPVITPESHAESFRNLLGVSDANDPRCESLSADRLVTDKHPACFIWTTATDDAVDPMATALYTAALIKNKVKFESHIFPSGRHGGGTCDASVLMPEEVPSFGRSHLWIELADEFLKSL